MTTESLSLAVTPVRERIVPAMSAWDEAASCLARGDFAGFDAAMRIYRQINKSTRDSKS